VPPSRRERIDEIQRARLLAAIAEVAAERGVANVAVSRVVARAGVSRRTFYELFDDRDDCLLAAVDDAIARVARDVLASYDPSADWTERVRCALTAVLRFVDAKRPASRLAVAALMGTVDGARERRERVLAHIVPFIDEARGLSGSGSQLPPLTAEGVVGGALAILHTRLAGAPHESAIELLGPLMSMIVLPYLGAAAARRELTRSSPSFMSPPPPARSNPLDGVGMRLTYRTIRVLSEAAALPGASNRALGEAAGIADQGQTSRLLSRLCGLGLIENSGPPSSRGAPNAWTLTDKGWQVHAALAEQAEVGRDVLPAR
jgi:AcrR family transcriptional regulator/DNA-binding MarR family transcriptional regulator